MRSVLLVLVLLLSSCTSSVKRDSYPVDRVWVQIAPGLFGSIRADHKVDGVWARDVTVIVRVLGAKDLVNVPCVITVDDRIVTLFDPNPDQMWTIRFPAGVGIHKIRVQVGPRSYEYPLNVWNEVTDVQR